MVKEGSYDLSKILSQVGLYLILIFLCMESKVNLPLALDGVAQPAPDDVKHLPHSGRDAEPPHDVCLLRLGLQRRHRVQQGVSECHEEGATSSTDGGS